MNPENIYPRTNDHETVYLKNVIKNPNILVGDFTMYNDFVYDPWQFEKNNVLYHYPINHDKLIIGKFCSIACGAKFLFTSANHTQMSLSTFPFPIFFEEWGLDVQNITSAWDNKGDISKTIPPLFYTLYTRFSCFLSRSDLRFSAESRR